MQGATVATRVQQAAAEYEELVSMDVHKELLSILDDALGLHGRAATLDEGSPLLGALPELDSLGVVKVITTIEERFGFAIADDEIDASSFATVGALSEFVKAKVAA
jgi:acyl carrier protein